MGFMSIQETLANGLSLTYAYDTEGRKTKVTLPDQSAIEYRYDERFLRGIQRLSSDGAVVYSHTYPHYGPRGNPTELNLIGLGVSGEVYTIPMMIT